MEKTIYRVRYGELQLAHKDFESILEAHSFAAHKDRLDTAKIEKIIMPLELEASLREVLENLLAAVEELDLTSSSIKSVHNLSKAEGAARKVLAKARGE